MGNTEFIVDKDNKEQNLAYELISKTNKCVFITGKAGTGKTTFIKRIQREIPKNFLILAPTGIAALTVGGQTLHSFFGLPMEVLGPYAKIQISPMNECLLKHVDSIIIDEVSMVRCDIVDAIDRYLRLTFKNNMPFAGKQIIFVGDLFQLPPVVKQGSVENEMLYDLYGHGTPFFYKAHVLKSMNLPKIEFQKVYRQENSKFVEILNKMRNGYIEDKDLDAINKQINTNAEIEPFSVILTGINKRAEQINSEKLDSIESEEVVYHGLRNGKFKPEECPVPEFLKLKVGAQVMFCRNNYYSNCANGTIAKVIKLDDDVIKVELEDGEEVNVERANWQSFEQVYNKETKKLESKSVGSYKQFPLRLAWAITIHRSQGMSFNRMHLDLSGGIFADGQTYVALSRMRSLDGLTLSYPLMKRHIKTNPEIKALANSFNDIEMIKEELTTGVIIAECLKNKDFDKAVESLFKISLHNIDEQDLRSAALTIKQMFDVMLDDENLKGITEGITTISGNSLTRYFLNSVICLYGKRYEEAIGYADMVLYRKKCLEAMFVKSRALYELGNFKEASDILFDITTISNNELDKKAIDQKLLLFEAKVNEKLGNSNIGISKELLKRCPSSFVQPYIFIREELNKGKEIIYDDDELQNPLIESFGDKSINNQSFIEEVSRYDYDSTEFKAFKNFITKIA